MSRRSKSSLQLRRLDTPGTMLSMRHLVLSTLGETFLLSSNFTTLMRHIAILSAGVEVHTSAAEVRSDVVQVLHCVRLVDLREPVCLRLAEDEWKR